MLTGEGRENMRNRYHWLGMALLPLLMLLALSGEAVPAMQQPTSYVALTFDDSPNRENTQRLLDGLKERGAKATFFIIGEQVEGNEDLLRRMVDEGHQIGNHTYTHRRLDTTGAVGLEEVQRTDAALRAAVGDGVFWVRPPWGFASPETLREIGVPLVYWSVDTEDWSVRDTQKIAERLEREVRSGDIVLLHDAYDTSVDAALQAIDALGARGFRFVTLQELFERFGVEPEAGKLYSRPDTIRQVP